MCDEPEDDEVEEEVEEEEGDEESFAVFDVVDSTTFSRSNLARGRVYR